MTQAFNLSQLANGVNSSGQLNAAANLYNQVPVANGGTGVATVASGAILVGAGTSAMTSVPAATANNVLTANGTAWVSSAVQGGPAPVLNVYTSPGTWTKPAFVKGIKVTVVGGGGAGGAGSVQPTGSAPIGGGGGGGGGASTFVYPAPSLPGPQPYTVGAAGASSSFGAAPITVITATAGSAGGASSPGSPVTVGTAGAGGAGSGGTLNFTGGAGGAGSYPFSSGIGGSSIFGGGAAPKSTVGVGNAGNAYGGGGSGGLGGAGGGAGASGVVILEEFY